MVTSIIISEEIKSLITQFPQNRTQILKNNAFDVVAFGKRIWTFADGSHISEAV
jgi:hypothetical protein